MVSLQALSEYAQRTYRGDTDLACDVTSTADGHYSRSWTVKGENSFVLQAAEVCT